MPKKKGRKKLEDAATEAQIIEMAEGWKCITTVGIQPFFERVESSSEGNFSKKNIPRDQYQKTYDTIFTMCIQREPFNFSEPLYERHTNALRTYFTEKFIPKLQAAMQLHSVAFLKEWVHRWRCCQWAVEGMKRMFMYLDRFYVPNSEDLLSTDKQGYTLFQDNIFIKFHEDTRTRILEGIRRERENEEQDRDLLRDAVKVFVDLGSKLKVELTLYKDHFQTHLINATKDWYKGMSRHSLDSSSCPDYLRKAEECVKNEQGRLSSYIHKSSKDDLMKATRTELLKNHQTELLAKDSGIDAMLERTQGGFNSPGCREAMDDLARLFRLYEAVDNGLAPIAEAMKDHVCRLGKKYIEKSQELVKTSKQGDRNHELITNLIKLHDRFLTLVRESFQGDQIFHKAMKEAFEEFINMNYFTSNYLAKFANDILRKGGHAKSMFDNNNSGEMEKTMDNVVTLYGYIRDKDIFERDYQTYLSHRLLQDLSESEHAEKSMIGKLKTESGYHWTSKLEDMFKDIQRSKELMVEFNRKHNSKLPLEMSVSVCTTGAWPTTTIVEVNMPDELKEPANLYKTFYSQLHSGRKLDYRMDLGKAEVQVTFSNTTKKVLVVSTYQMMVLLLFNKKKVLRFKDILEMTGIPSKQLAWHILSLAHPKVKVLRKDPNSKKIEDDHRFGINPKYKNARARVQIPLMAKPQEDDPGAAKRQQILFLRQHQMDAAIVRIMKARKSQAHAELVAEVTRQLNNRFTPSPNDIKRRIACLIDQDYIVRDEKERTRYHYKM